MPRRKNAKIAPVPVAPVPVVPVPVAPVAPVSPGFFDQLYGGAAEIGQATSMVGAVIGTLFSVIMIGAGIYMLSSDPSLPDMIITSPNALITQAQRFNDAKSQRTKVGWMLILFGVIILVLVWLYWWFTRKSKAVAALAGGAAVMDLFGFGDD
jgi:hypothetical protein